jgi:hypothetical protein
VQSVDDADGNSASHAPADLHKLLLAELEAAP